jgi:hypothetical protein
MKSVLVYIIRTERADGQSGKMDDPDDSQTPQASFIVPLTVPQSTFKKKKSDVYLGIPRARLDGLSRSQTRVSGRFREVGFRNGLGEYPENVGQRDNECRFASCQV